MTAPDWSAGWYSSMDGSSILRVEAASLGRAKLKMKKYACVCRNTCYKLSDMVQIQRSGPSLINT